MVYIHQFVASFVVAFIIALLLLELVCFRSRAKETSFTSWVFVSFFLCAALATYVTGFVSFESGDTTMSELLAQHHQSAIVLMLLLVPLTLLKYLAERAEFARVTFRIVYLLTLLIAVLFAVQTWWRGDSLLMAIV